MSDRPNIYPSASASYPPNATPEQKARIDRIIERAAHNVIPYGWHLAEYLIGLEDRIAELEQALAHLTTKR